MAVLAWSVSYGDHNSPLGSVGLLMTEAEELNQVVQYSTLGYSVKQAVSNFSYSVQQLVDCVRSNGRPVVNDHLEDPFCPESCSRQLQSTRYSFRIAERSLYDTNWDYPEVYRAYVSVRRALNAITVSGHNPGPGPQLISCVAVDNGWEEHFGGHVGYGRSIYDAQRAALMECQRVHGRCRIRSCR